MNAGTLLLRQISPAFRKEDGQVGYLAFRPFPKDQGKVSVYDGDQIAADEAWRHYKNELHLESVGVMAVTASECEGNRAIPNIDGNPYPAHGQIDFSALSKKEVKAAAKGLAGLATRRGWLYQPPQNEITC